MDRRRKKGYLMEAYLTGTYHNGEDPTRGHREGKHQIHQMRDDRHLKVVLERDLERVDFHYPR